jgi:hypothetical protein
VGGAENDGGGPVRDDEGGIYDDVGAVVVLYGLFVRSVGALNDGFVEAVCVVVVDEGVDLVEAVVPEPGEVVVCCHRLLTSKKFNTVGCERGKWAARSIA